MRSSDHGDGLRENVSDGVLTLTLDRPQRRNAIDAAMRDALHAALDRAAREQAIAAVILTGAGGAFCAGGDLDTFEDRDP